MTALCVCGHHNVLRGILDVGLERLLLTRQHLNRALGVRNSGRGAHEHGRIKLLGELVGEHGEVLALLRIGRLEHRHLRGNRVVAGILLILRGVHTRVVGDSDHKAAVDAGVRRGIERVCGDVQADVLHRREGSRAGKARAQRRFNGNLFIRRPLCIDFLKLCDLLGDLRGRRSRVARRKAAARLVESACERLVSKHQFLHHSSPFTVWYTLRASIPARIRHPSVRGRPSRGICAASALRGRHSSRPRPCPRGFPLRRRRP